MNLLKYIPSMDGNEYVFSDSLLKIKLKLQNKFTIKDFLKILKERLQLIEAKGSSWENIFLQDEFIKIVDPIRQKDSTSKQVKSAFEVLLNFNGHQSLLHYTLPRIVTRIDPEGCFIPSMICEKIQEKTFLCEPLKDIPKECEWIRYAGYYPINSKSWRKIATLACKIAVTKSDKQKNFIFSDLLSQTVETFSGAHGEVPKYFYSKVANAQKDFEQERDPNIIEFMKWRLDRDEKRLETEKTLVIERQK
ncbi:MAG: hypothetical protein OXK80_06760 [Bdellovibrionales bacterium]|nr:hypothetical protein [Bdellovibrionales bacterium]